MEWATEAVVSAGCTLAVDVHRGTGPTVVILHSQLGVRDAFRRFGEAVDGATVAIPDLRGRGGSVCVNASSYSWSQFVDDVVAVLDHLRCREAILAGASMGAGVALATALRRPERVRALVLWAPPYSGNRVGWSERQRPSMLRTLEIARSVGSRGPSDAGSGSGSEGDIPPRWARHDGASIAAAITAIGLEQPFDELTQLRTIDVPVAVAPGNDDLHPMDIGEAYLRVLPRAERIDLSLAAFGAFVERVAPHGAHPG